MMLNLLMHMQKQQNIFTLVFEFCQLTVDLIGGVQFDWEYGQTPEETSWIASSWVIAIFN